MREFITLYSLQFVSYLNITLDMRAVAHEQYAIAAAPNLVAPVIASVSVNSVDDVLVAMNTRFCSSGQLVPRPLKNT